jgi:hypothetical protein
MTGAEVLMLVLFFACSSPDTAPSSAGETAQTAPDSETGSETATESEAIDGDALRAHLDRHEGTWVGSADPTPVGAFPFGWSFGWQGDDTLTAFADSGYGFTFTWTYSRADDGTWTLVESGEMAGVFKQSYVLTPASIDGDVVTWIYPDDPDYLSATVEAGEDTLRLEAKVRGETHAVLSLTRQD